MADLQALYFVIMKWLIVFASVSVTTVQAQVLNGPMVGHIDHMEAHIWMQCPGGCEFGIEYRLSGESDWQRTRTIESASERAHTNTFIIRNLIPGSEYQYRPLVNGEVAAGLSNLSFHTEPVHRYRDSIPTFKVALGSCAYLNDAPYDRPGDPYGNENGIFNSIADETPDLMLWLGDNIYLREPDWGSLSGYQYRYTHTRGYPGLQKLLRTGAHYAIWDDHDFGPNDATGAWVNAEMAKEAFMDFWANPTYGVPGATKGISTQFQFLDVDFFLLDNRTYRELPNKKGTARMLGKKQLEQLIEALDQSKASFKLILVGGQVLNPEAVFENFAQYTEERQQLIDEIVKRGIRNLVFLTGDRHRTELSKVVVEGLRILDLTVSPLSSKAYAPFETNEAVVEGTMIDTQNYATLEFQGAPGERSMFISVKSPTGEVFWTKEIRQMNKVEK